MTEKSGIDMLEEILQRLSVIESRLGVMDNNIKAIVNSSRIADMVNKAADTSLDGWSKATKPAIAPALEQNYETGSSKGFKNFKFAVSDASKLPGPPEPHRGARSTKKANSILVTGKLRITKGDKTIPLSGVSVKIYNTQNEVVKSTKTNRAGHWMSHLVPGQYVALFEGEVNGKKLLPQNKNFKVPEKLPEGKIEFEVI